MFEGVIEFLFLSDNREWIFSGVGVAVIGFLWAATRYFYKKRREKKTGENNKTDQMAEAIHLNKRGIEAINQGQYREALNYFQQGLDIIREVGDRAGEGATLNNIGGVYRKQGLYEQALETHNRALVIARQIGSRPMEETILNNIKNLPDD